MINTILKNGLILGGFALVTTSIIAVTFSLTHKRIEQAKEEQLLKTLTQVVDNSLHDNKLHLDCIIVEANEWLGSAPQRVFRARLAGNNTALIIEATAPDGYSGAIDLVVALNTNNVVLGTRVINHKETPGLGDKIELRISDWILGFDGVKYEGKFDHRWQVKKDGGQFDQFTGATITPRSVVNAIKNAAIYGQANMKILFDTPTNCTAPLEKQSNTTNPSSLEETASE